MDGFNTQMLKRNEMKLYDYTEVFGRGDGERAAIAMGWECTMYLLIDTENSYDDELLGGSEKQGKQQFGVFIERVQD